MESRRQKRRTTTTATAATNKKMCKCRAADSFIALVQTQSGNAGGREKPRGRQCHLDEKKERRRIFRHKLSQSV